jgi:hypothetical protein
MATTVPGDACYFALLIVLSRGLYSVMGLRCLSVMSRTVDDGAFDPQFKIEVVVRQQNCSYK